ncbi:DNA-binding protein [Croceicoccus ponticola]|uniref:DNA-binding protein n=1 Tax=Croceicoccus ponticola TaxID=2217664 RepID=A0A437H275_9SPHN|nr:helix-hairpin-helix domain-containing protein [Croceicoccus ponticola]RVQ69583.1 DNA-binding protein [Croceicoccus ponticola]
MATATKPLADLAVNRVVADRLHEYADLLEQQEAGPFRVRAYRRAADTVAGLATPVASVMAKGGRAGLEALPTIGRGIAAAIAEMVVTGGWSQLDRLRGDTDPASLFTTLPGIGAKLAARICEGLHIDDLATLEMAAYDGRLAGLPGFGERRLRMVRDGLAQRLGRQVRLGRGGRSVPEVRQPRPDVATLLDVDREYRARAEDGTLPKIAPRRFNPEKVAWLPILHTTRDGWHFTALYSNTQRAHALGRNRDWVVIFYHTDDLPEDQCTVVTERRGTHAAQRVVRGREAEVTGDSGGLA